VAPSVDEEKGHLMIRRWITRWWKLHVTLALVAVMVAGVTIALNSSQVRAGGVSGAAFTTVNETADGTGHCLNGNGTVNCNIYDGKQYVWMSGGPSSAALGDGSYFFAVLVPGGQPNANDDAGASNLSAPNDSYTDRTFTILNGAISNPGTHTFDSGLIKLAPYNDTSNAGGVYILAICSLASGYPAAANDCKYDAFKVTPTTAPSPQDLVVTKDANPSFQRAYTWNIQKAVDKTKVEQIGGTATFNYTVTATHSDAHDSQWQVTGTIQVLNPNDTDFSGVTVADAINDSNAACVVSGGDNVTIAANAASQFDYTCSYSAAPSTNAQTNTATASWDGKSYGTPDSSASFSIGFTFEDGSAGNPSIVDNCASVKDTFNGTATALGAPCVGDTNPTVYTYAHTVAVPQYNCVTYNNTAAFTTNTTDTTSSATKSVQVCGPAHTGALTMGFWQNKNGQGIITSTASSNVGGAHICTLTTWLRQYAPYQDLSPTATCAQAATYVYNAIKAANAGGSTMNPMLKAQMLATALDVYYSDPALGGNKIGAYNGLGTSQQPIGAVAIDLTHICKMIDGSGGGSCGSSYEDVSPAFFGAPNLTVSQMLSYAASQSNAGGGTWYANYKPTQGLAKDAFDAINNQVAFGA
jgi:hypothetical protein